MSAIDWCAVGHRIRVTRVMLGLTEEQAAAGFGVTLRTYRRYEAGRSAENRIVDFARHYDVSFDWLIDGVPEEKSPALKCGAVSEVDRSVQRIIAQSALA